MDALTTRVAEKIDAAFGDEISDIFFADIVDTVADAIARTTIADAEADVAS